MVSSAWMAMDQLTTGFLLFSYQFIAVAGSEMDVHPYIIGFNHQPVPMTDPNGAAIYIYIYIYMVTWCAMDPINIPPKNVSINVPAPWIRHGVYIYIYLHKSRLYPIESL